MLHSESALGGLFHQGLDLMRLLKTKSSELDWTCSLFLVTLLGVNIGAVCCRDLRGIHNYGHQSQNPRFP